MTPKRPALPEGTDPVAALRQLQQQLAEARYMPLGKGGYQPEARAADQGGRDAERAAGMNLAPIVDAVETLVGTLRQQVQELEPFGSDPSLPAWYGSVWCCPVGECKWTHREENAVSSTDTEAAKRVRAAVVAHLYLHVRLDLVDALAARVFDWPAHCSEWIAGADPENPDMCPEYASPGSDKCALHDPRQVEYAAELMARQGWLSPSQAAELRATAHRLTVEAFVRPLSPDQARNVAHLGSPDAVPTCPGYAPGGGPDGRFCTTCGQSVVRHRQPPTAPRLVMPPAPGTVWRFGFPGKDASTVWRCQGCGRLHEPNPPRCLGCGHTVLDPGHWVALPPAGTEA